MHTRQFPRDGISTNPQLKLSLGPPDLVLLGVTFIARSKYLRADSIWLASDCLRIKKNKISLIKQLYKSEIMVQ